MLSWLPNDVPLPSPSTHHSVQDVHLRIRAIIVPELRLIAVHGLLEGLQHRVHLGHTVRLPREHPRLIIVIAVIRLPLLELEPPRVILNNFHRVSLRRNPTSRTSRVKVRSHHVVPLKQLINRSTNITTRNQPSRTSRTPNRRLIVRAIRGSELIPLSGHRPNTSPVVVIRQVPSNHDGRAVWNVTDLLFTVPSWLR